MSSASSVPKSSIGWKIAAIVFIVLTVGASSVAYYYYGQNQDNINKTASSTADRNNYYTMWQADENKIMNLNQQISTDNNQITSDKTQISSDQSTIASDQSQITQLQSQLYNPSCKPNCDSQIAALNAQINLLNIQINADNILIASDTAQIITDMNQIQSLNGEVASLKELLGLKKSQSIASSVTKDEPQCGETNQPSCQGSTACTNPANCTPRYILPTNFLSFCSTSCYQGVLVVNWTSTQQMSLSFTSSYQASNAITMSSSSTSSAFFAFPLVANFTTTGGLTTLGIHNDSCTKDIAGNYHCAAFTMTYSEAYDY